MYVYYSNILTLHCLAKIYIHCLSLSLFRNIIVVGILLLLILKFSLLYMNLNSYNSINDGIYIIFTYLIYFFKLNITHILFYLVLIFPYSQPQIYQILFSFILISDIDEDIAVMRIYLSIPVPLNKLYQPYLNPCVCLT